MSFLGFGRPQPTSAEKIAAAEAEMKMMADMMTRYGNTFYSPSRPCRMCKQHQGLQALTIVPCGHRLTRACAKKCVPNDYREGELNKGESVCLDRCAAKFFDVHMKISENMQQQAQGQGGGF